MFSGQGKSGLSRAVAAGVTATAVTVLAMNDAYAQGRLEADYKISVAGVTVGESSWTADVGDVKYTASATTRMKGVVRWIVRGEGSATLSGNIVNGQPTPTDFRTVTSTEDENSVTRVVFDNGVVKQLIDEPPPPVKDRVAVPEEHLRGIIDPISAMLIPVATDGESIPRDACERTLHVFDGRRRYDLRLGFKKMDRVKADKGYAGPAIVCTMAMDALSGHKAGGMLVGYLTQGRDMELWLAPITGTRLLAPFRISVGNLVSSLTMHATRFEGIAKPEVAKAPLAAPPEHVPELAGTPQAK